MKSSDEIHALNYWVGLRANLQLVVTRKILVHVVKI